MAGSSCESHFGSSRNSPIGDGILINSDPTDGRQDLSSSMLSREKLDLPSSMLSHEKLDLSSSMLSHEKLDLSSSMLSHEKLDDPYGPGPRKEVPNGTIINCEPSGQDVSCQFRPVQEVSCQSIPVQISTNWQERDKEEETGESGRRTEDDWMLINAEGSSRDEWAHTPVFFGPEPEPGPSAGRGQDEAGPSGLHVQINVHPPEHSQYEHREASSWAEEMPGPSNTKKVATILKKSSAKSPEYDWRCINVEEPENIVSPATSIPESNYLSDEDVTNTESDIFRQSQEKGGKKHVHFTGSSECEVVDLFDERSISFAFPKEKCAISCGPSLYRLREQGLERARHGLHKLPEDITVQAVKEKFRFMDEKESIKVNVTCDGNQNTSANDDPKENKQGAVIIDMSCPRTNSAFQNVAKLPRNAATEKTSCTSSNNNPEIFAQQDGTEDSNGSKETAEKIRADDDSQIKDGSNQDKKANGHTDKMVALFTGLQTKPNSSPPPPEEETNSAMEAGGTVVEQAMETIEAKVRAAAEVIYLSASKRVMSLKGVKSPRINFPPLASSEISPRGFHGNQGEMCARDQTNTQSVKAILLVLQSMQNMLVRMASSTGADGCSSHVFSDPNTWKDGFRPIKRKPPYKLSCPKDIEVVPDGLYACSIAHQVVGQARKKISELYPACSKQINTASPPDGDTEERDYASTDMALTAMKEALKDLEGFGGNKSYTSIAVETSDSLTSLRTDYSHGEEECCKNSIDDDPKTLCFGLLSDLFDAVVKPMDERDENCPMETNPVLSSSDVVTKNIDVRESELKHMTFELVSRTMREAIWVLWNARGNESSSEESQLSAPIAKVDTAELNWKPTDAEGNRANLCESPSPKNDTKKRDDVSAAYVVQSISNEIHGLITKLFKHLESVESREELSAIITAAETDSSTASEKLLSIVAHCARPEAKLSLCDRMLGQRSASMLGQRSASFTAGSNNPTGQCSLDNSRFVPRNTAVDLTTIQQQLDILKSDNGAASNCLPENNIPESSLDRSSVPSACSTQEQLVEQERCPSGTEDMPERLESQTSSMLTEELCHSMFSSKCVTSSSNVTDSSTEMMSHTRSATLDSQGASRDPLHGVLTPDAAPARPMSVRTSGFARDRMLASTGFGNVHLLGLEQFLRLPHERLMMTGGNHPEHVQQADQNRPSCSGSGKDAEQRHKQPACRRGACASQSMAGGVQAGGKKPACGHCSNSSPCKHHPQQHQQQQRGTKLLAPGSTPLSKFKHSCSEPKLDFYKRSKILLYPRLRGPLFDTDSPDASNDDWAIISWYPPRAITPHDDVSSETRSENLIAVELEEGVTPEDAEAVLQAMAVALQVRPSAGRLPFNPVTRNAHLVSASPSPSGRSDHQAARLCFRDWEERASAFTSCGGSDRPALTSCRREKEAAPAEISRGRDHPPCDVSDCNREEETSAFTFCGRDHASRDASDCNREDAAPTLTCCNREEEASAFTFCGRDHASRDASDCNREEAAPTLTCCIREEWAAPTLMCCNREEFTSCDRDHAPSDASDFKSEEAASAFTLCGKDLASRDASDCDREEAAPTHMCCNREEEASAFTTCGIDHASRDASDCNKEQAAPTLTCCDMEEGASAFTTCGTDHASSGASDCNRGEAPKSSFCGRKYASRDASDCNRELEASVFMSCGRDHASRDASDCNREAAPALACCSREDGVSASTSCHASRDASECNRSEEASAFTSCGRDHPSFKASDCGKEYEVSAFTCGSIEKEVSALRYCGRDHLSCTAFDCNREDATLTLTCCKKEEEEASAFTNCGRENSSCIASDCNREDATRALTCCQKEEEAEALTSCDREHASNTASDCDNEDARPALTCCRKEENASAFTYCGRDHPSRVASNCNRKDSMHALTCCKRDEEATVFTYSGRELPSHAASDHNREDATPASTFCKKEEETTALTYCGRYIPSRIASDCNREASAFSSCHREHPSRASSDCTVKREGVAPALTGFKREEEAAVFTYCARELPSRTASDCNREDANPPLPCTTEEGASAFTFCGRKISSRAASDCNRADATPALTCWKKEEEAAAFTYCGREYPSRSASDCNREDAARALTCCKREEEVSAFTSCGRDHLSGKASEETTPAAAGVSGCAVLCALHRHACQPTSPRCEPSHRPERDSPAADMLREGQLGSRPATQDDTEHARVQHTESKHSSPSRLSCHERVQHTESRHSSTSHLSCHERVQHTESRHSTPSHLSCHERVQHTESKHSSSSHLSCHERVQHTESKHSSSSHLSCHERVQHTESQHSSPSHLSGRESTHVCSSSGSMHPLRRCQRQRDVSVAPFVCSNCVESGGHPTRPTGSLSLQSPFLELSTRAPQRHYSTSALHSTCPLPRARKCEIAHAAATATPPPPTAVCPQCMTTLKTSSPPPASESCNRGEEAALTTLTSCPPPTEIVGACCSNSCPLLLKQTGDWQQRGCVSDVLEVCCRKRAAGRLASSVAGHKEEQACPHLRSSSLWAAQRNAVPADRLKSWNDKNANGIANGRKPSPRQLSAAASTPQANLFTVDCDSTNSLPEESSWFKIPEKTSTTRGAIPVPRKQALRHSKSQGGALRQALSRPDLSQHTAISVRAGTQTPGRQRSDVPVRPSRAPVRQRSDVPVGPSRSPVRQRSDVPVGPSRSPVRQRSDVPVGPSRSPVRQRSDVPVGPSRSPVRQRSDVPVGPWCVPAHQRSDVPVGPSRAPVRQRSDVPVGPSRSPVRQRSDVPVGPSRSPVRQRSDVPVGPWCVPAHQRSDVPVGPSRAPVRQRSDDPVGPWCVPVRQRSDVPVGPSRSPVRQRSDDPVGPWCVQVRQRTDVPVRPSRAPVQQRSDDPVGPWCVQVRQRTDVPVRPSRSPVQQRSDVAEGPSRAPVRQRSDVPASVFPARHNSASSVVSGHAQLNSLGTVRDPAMCLERTDSTSVDVGPTHHDCKDSCPALSARGRNLRLSKLALPPNCRKQCPVLTNVVRNELLLRESPPGSFHHVILEASSSTSSSKGPALVQPLPANRPALSDDLYNDCSVDTGCGIHKTEGLRTVNSGTLHTGSSGCKLGSATPSRVEARTSPFCCTDTASVRSIISAHEQARVFSASSSSQARNNNTYRVHASGRITTDSAQHGGGRMSSHPRDALKGAFIDVDGYAEVSSKHVAPLVARRCKELIVKANNVDSVGGVSSNRADDVCTRNFYRNNKLSASLDEGVDAESCGCSDETKKTHPDTTSLSRCVTQDFSSNNKSSASPQADVDAGTCGLSDETKKSRPDTKKSSCYTGHGVPVIDSVSYSFDTINQAARGVLCPRCLTCTLGSPVMWCTPIVFCENHMGFPHPDRSTTTDENHRCLVANTDWHPPGACVSCAGSQKQTNSSNSNNKAESDTFDRKRKNATSNQNTFKSYLVCVDDSPDSCIQSVNSTSKAEQTAESDCQDHDGSPHPTGQTPRGFHSDLSAASPPRSTSSRLSCVEAADLGADPEDSLLGIKPRSGSTSPVPRACTSPTCTPTLNKGKAQRDSNMAFHAASKNASMLETVCEVTHSACEDCQLARESPSSGVDCVLLMQTQRGTPRSHSPCGNEFRHCSLSSQIVSGSVSGCTPRDALEEKTEAGPAPTDSHVSCASAHGDGSCESRGADATLMAEETHSKSKNSLPRVSCASVDSDRGHKKGTGEDALFLGEEADPKHSLSHASCASACGNGSRESCISNGVDALSIAGETNRMPFVNGRPHNSSRRVPVPINVDSLWAKAVSVGVSVMRTGNLDPFYSVSSSHASESVKSAEEIALSATMGTVNLDYWTEVSNARKSTHVPVERCHSSHVDVVPSDVCCADHTDIISSKDLRCSVKCIDTTAAIASTRLRGTKRFRDASVSTDEPELPEAREYPSSSSEISKVEDDGGITADVADMSCQTCRSPSSTWLTSEEESSCGETVTANSPSQPQRKTNHLHHSWMTPYAWEVHSGRCSRTSCVDSSTWIGGRKPKPREPNFTTSISSRVDAFISLYNPDWFNPRYSETELSACTMSVKSRIPGIPRGVKPTITLTGSSSAAGPREEEPLAAWHGGTGVDWSVFQSSGTGVDLASLLDRPDRREGEHSVDSRSHLVDSVDVLMRSLSRELIAEKAHESEGCAVSPTLHGSSTKDDLWSVLFQKNNLTPDATRYLLENRLDSLRRLRKEAETIANSSATTRPTKKRKVDPTLPSPKNSSAGSTSGLKPAMDAAVCANEELVQLKLKNKHCKPKKRLNTNTNYDPTGSSFTTGDTLSALCHINFEAFSRFSNNKSVTDDGSDATKSSVDEFSVECMDFFFNDSKEETQENVEISEDCADRTGENLDKVCTLSMDFFNDSEDETQTIVNGSVDEVNAESIDLFMDLEETHRVVDGSEDGFKSAGKSQEEVSGSVNLFDATEMTQGMVSGIANAFKSEDKSQKVVRKDLNLFDSFKGAQKSQGKKGMSVQHQHRVSPRQRSLRVEAYDVRHNVVCDWIGVTGVFNDSCNSTAANVVVCSQPEKIHRGINTATIHDSIHSPCGGRCIETDEDDTQEKSHTNRPVGECSPPFSNGVNTNGHDNEIDQTAKTAKETKVGITKETQTLPSGNTSERQLSNRPTPKKNHEWFHDVRETDAEDVRETEAEHEVTECDFDQFTSEVHSAKLRGQLALRHGVQPGKWDQSSGLPACDEEGVGCGDDKAGTDKRGCLVGAREDGSRQRPLCRTDVSHEVAMDTGMRSLAARDHGRVHCRETGQHATPDIYGEVERSRAEDARNQQHLLRQCKRQVKTLQEELEQERELHKITKDSLVSLSTDHNAFRLRVSALREQRNFKNSGRLKGTFGCTDSGADLQSH